MTILRTKYVDVLDRPARWDRYLKPWFDVVGYQKRIDSRVGTNKDRKSIIRLVWGQDISQQAFDEETPRYWIKRRKDGTGWKYWKVPRWIFEKRLEPEQYIDSWERSRWSIADPETGRPVDKGPAPEEWYTFAYLCARHEAEDKTTGWPQCCTRAYYTDRRRCWGKYRPPSEDDLQLLSQAVRQMEADKFRDPYRPLTLNELREAELAANLQVERAAEEFENYERQLMADIQRSIGWRLFETDPTKLHHGKYHFVGRPSGLVVPE